MLAWLYGQWKPRGWRLGLLGAGVEETLYVGDSETDADTAAAAGMGFALYSGGYRKRPLAQFEDCFVFHDFAVLTEHLVARAGI